MRGILFVMKPHALVLEAETENGVAYALEFAEKELGISGSNNPDVLVLRYGLLSVESAREVFDYAVRKAQRGTEKVLIVAVARLYHEAQNALLKLFEEPPLGTTLILIVPSVGTLLPTLLSRVEVRSLLKEDEGGEAAATTLFVQASRAERSVLIKKLSSGKDDDERRENRDEALTILNGVERIAYRALKKGELPHALVPLLEDISVLRDTLHDRSAPVRMILEHVSLVLPKELSVQG